MSYAGSEWNHSNAYNQGTLIRRVVVRKILLGSRQRSKKNTGEDKLPYWLDCQKLEKGPLKPWRQFRRLEEEQWDLVCCACEVFFTSEEGGDKFDKIWLLANALSDLFIRNDIWQKLDWMCSSRWTNLNKLTGFINVLLFFSVSNPSSQLMPVWW